MEDGVFTIALLSSGLRLATPIILAALGGAICQRAGVLNLALEAKMLLGAFVAIVMAYYLGNTYLGIVVAVAFGGMLGLIIDSIEIIFSFGMVGIPGKGAAVKGYDGHHVVKIVSDTGC